MEWTKSKAVLSKMRQVLICNICQNTLVNPVSYGQCCHLFCSECIKSHPGGICPASGCSAVAEVRTLKHHKRMDSITKSIAKISHILGDEIPDEMIRHLSVEDEENEPDLLVGIDKKNIKTKDKSAEYDILADENRECFAVEPEVKKSTLKERNRQVSGGKKPAPAKSVPVKRKRNESNNKKQPIVTVEQEPQKAANKIKVPEPPKAKDIPRTTGLNLDKRNKKGETQLHQAAVKGNLEAVRKLLREGASANTVDNAGWSPLHEAAAAGNTEMVSLLLNHGASPNIHDKNSNLTPLHDAAESGFVDIVRLLVSHGADTKARSSTGKTPFDVARNDGVSEALANTVCLMTESEAMDQSVIAEDVLMPTNVVLACPECSDSEMKKIVQAASSLKMHRPSRQFSENTTHCVLHTGKQLNILSCQLLGSLPLQEEWIFQCKQLGTMVDTEPFIYQHPDMTPEARQRSRDCRMRGQPRLFTGIHFYLAGGFDTKNLSKADLTKLLTLSGAKIVYREPNPENLPPTELTVAHYAEEESGLSNTSHIILYQEGSKKEPLLKYKMDHVKTLPVAWLVQSILQHKLVQPDLFVP
jgi:hypothetical protein